MSESPSLRPSPRNEFLFHFRFVLNGRPGPLNRRYFTSPREALRFLGALDAARDGALVTLSRREVGSWEQIRRLDVEEAAAEEGR